MGEKKITLDSIIKDDKTLGEFLNENFDEAKKWVFECIKEENIPDNDILRICRIKRIVHEPVITQVVFDRVVKKDNIVYKKDTAKLDKILKEINTLENGESEE